MSTFRGRGRGGWRGAQLSSSVPSVAPSLARRGGGFSSRGRGGAWGAHHKRNDQECPDLVKHPLGETLETLEASDLAAEATTVTPASITDCKYVASYNWVKGESPTVVVPGRPPQWAPPAENRKLEQDSGDFFRDPNGARYPSYPVEPAVRSVVELNPEFDTPSIDIFACGSTLGHLLRFARGYDRPFRLTVEAIGNTVFLIRKENSAKEVLKNVRGFGHTFPDTYMTYEDDVQNSESHQRLIQYNLGGLKCIIRFEVDGYLPKKAGFQKAEPSAASTSIDDLAAALDATTLHSSSNLTVIHGGSEVPQSSIFDAKTRSGRWGKAIDMNDILPILWLKQFPNFIVAYHNGEGLFQDIRVQDIRRDIREWEKENREALSRYNVVLQKIVELARVNKGSRLDVYSPSAERLEVHKMDPGHDTATLPPMLRAEWEGAPDKDEGGSEDGVDIPNKLDDETADSGYFDSDVEELDYTACSVNSCGYCGRCSY